MPVQPIPPALSRPNHTQTLFGTKKSVNKRRKDQIGTMLRTPDGRAQVAHFLTNRIIADAKRVRDDIDKPTWMAVAAGQAQHAIGIVTNAFRDFAIRTLTNASPNYELFRHIAQNKIGRQTLETALRVGLEDPGMVQRVSTYFDYMINRAEDGQYGRAYPLNMRETINKLLGLDTAYAADGSPPVFA